MLTLIPAHVSICEEQRPYGEDMKFWVKKKGKEEIFVGFADEIGILDLQGVEEYTQNENVKKVYLIARKPLGERVLEYLKTRSALKGKIEFKRADRLRDEVRKIKRMNSQHYKVKVYDLREFGKRAMSLDPC
ncbi:hypothetical protein J7M22_15400 [Candidatus Poribacteria bacterium]|nr:hypothetical protein [Candidatus Poribacteria bacterium]